MQKGFVTMLILSIIIGIFAISNSAVVTIDFIFTEVVLSQAIVIFICVLLGFVLASIFGYMRQRTLNKSVKQLTKENQTVKSEAYELKVQVDQLTKQLKEKEEELIILDLQVSENDKLPESGLEANE